MKVVIAEPVADRLKELIIQENKDWVFYDEGPKNREDFIERIKDADVVSAYSLFFDDELLSQCPNLKYLAIPAVGAGSYVDMDSASHRGITVMNCPGYNCIAVAEMAIGLAIDVLREISMLNSKMKQGYWEHNPTGGSLLSGKRIGLVGYGNVGKTIHRLLKDWCSGFEIVNSTSSNDDIDNAMKASDVIFLCCPLNDKTAGMINAERMDMMKSTAVLINVARGAVVDEGAFYEKLLKKQIQGAGIDVFCEEPAYGEPVNESILRFTRLENVVCTSHVAGSSAETRKVLGQMIFDNIESCIVGNPINIFK